MRYLYTIFLFLALTFYGFSQEKTAATKVDSVTYYLELSDFNKGNFDFDKALLYAQKSKRYSQKNDLKKELADSYLTIGEIYHQLSRYNEAIENYIHSISLYNNFPPSSNSAFCYYSLGLSYLEKNALSLSENYFNKAEAEYKAIKMPEAIDLIDLQKGVIMKNKNDISGAVKQFKKIIQKNSSENLFDAKAEAYFQLSGIEEKSNINSAIKNLEKAYVVSKESSNTSLRLRIIRRLSDYYDQTKSTNLSHYYLREFVKIRDSIFNMRNKSAGAPVYEKYIANEQLKAIDKMNRENKAQEKSIKFSKLISILSIALISILSLLSLSLYKNNIIRTKTNQLLRDKNLELENAKEKAEKASKARAEFLSTVSHELRTPLNAINGITHILIDDNPKPEQMNYLNSLKFSGNYLLTFINDILEINRVESDVVEVEKIPFDLRELLENILNSFTEIANKNKTVYHLQIDEKIPSVLIGDPTKLSQIFINLINNAIKFTKKGNVWIIASVKKEKNNSVRIYFEVRDSGIGIPKEKQDTIFDSFTQGSVEINRTYGGTGLGLAIVKRLVHLLGGKIQLQSEVNHGCRFYFDLAFKISKNRIEKKTGPAYEDSWLENKKILLVEDNKINQMITQKMLERKKMSCYIIENGEEAVEHVRENTYDLILMDVHLPGINGTTATELIRKFNQETPIVALTAISLDENREMLLSFGMNEVITKPFDPEKFYEIIATTINQKVNIA
ncbi:ATP-binding protein [Flavobacterium sp. SM15]|uniref:tetratricopeptide repeat-containing hybrid sensor histidine kinase/response regulator n=1 Tax=Flavobacterium sp. SM15 TaxID=2908005 RepID=UPI001EDC6EE6|nr:ATP-binding protein [Flavobacterium sp. SM15]MCG2611184.1 ATP-binding protein [Flavobacterium sp. SM15]